MKTAVISLTESGRLLSRRIADILPETERWCFARHTDAGARSFTDLAALTAELLYVYDLTPDDVRMHADFMDKVCPHRLITEGRVDDFKDMIRKDYEQIVRERTEEEGQNDGKEG